MPRALKHLPVADAPKGLRDRMRKKDGTVRLWWEPSGAAAQLGFEIVELDAARLSWSIAEAKRLSREVQDAIDAGRRFSTPASGRTMARLIQAYRASREFLDLKPKTRAGYDGYLNIINEKWGDHAVIDFTKPVLQEWYETNLEVRGTRMAQALNGQLRILFSFSERKGWRAENSNPAMGLKIKSAAKGKRIVDWAELDALVSAAQDLELPGIAVAVLLATLQGQRLTQIHSATCGEFELHKIQVTHPLSDLICACRDQLSGDNKGLSIVAELSDHLGLDDPKPTRKEVWAWRVDRTKRGTLGLVYLHQEVVPWITRTIDGRDADEALLIRPATNRPYTDDGLRKDYNKVRAHAAETLPSVADLTFRDMRRSFGPLARQGGASKGDVGDVLGNTAAQNPALADIYMQSLLETTARAVEAIRRPGQQKGN